MEEDITVEDAESSPEQVATTAKKRSKRAKKSAPDSEPQEDKLSKKKREHKDSETVVDEDAVKPAHKTKKEKKRKRDAEGEREEDGVDVDMMDADAEPVHREDGEEEWDGTEEMRKRVLDKYMEDVYGMEFNDVVSTPSFHQPNSSLTALRA